MTCATCDFFDEGYCRYYPAAWAPHEQATCVASRKACNQHHTTEGFSFKPTKEPVGHVHADQKKMKARSGKKWDV